jgi:hypothetical protein
MEEDLVRYLPGSLEYLIQEALIESFQEKYNPNEGKKSEKIKNVLNFYK